MGKHLKEIQGCIHAEISSKIPAVILEGTLEDIPGTEEIRGKILDRISREIVTLSPFIRIR